jgi:CRISPR-associated protein Cas5h
MARRELDSTPQGGRLDEQLSAPTVAPTGVPSECLSFTIRSDWGHFRRIDRTVTKQTYRIPPRTTVAGILAAITGVHRDGYYDTFAEDVSAIAIQPVGELRTVTEPSLGLGTNPGETMAQAGGTGQKTVKVSYPDSTDNRQIHSYELLVNPAYRLYVAVEDSEFYAALTARLESGTSYYPPSMGLSEHLAWIDYHGRCDVEPHQTDSTEPVTLDSALPNGVEETVPQRGVSYAVERVPGFMDADEQGRWTTGYVDYAFTTTEGTNVDVVPQSVTPARVHGENGPQTVVFC